MELNNNNEEMMSLNDLYLDENVRYFSGFFVSKLRKEYTDKCLRCSCAIEGFDSETKPFLASCKTYGPINQRGGLSQSNKHRFQICIIAESVFQKYYENNVQLNLRKGAFDLLFTEIIQKLPHNILVDANDIDDDDVHNSQHRFKLVDEIVSRYVNIRLKHETNLERANTKHKVGKRHLINRLCNFQGY